MEVHEAGVWDNRRDTRVEYLLCAPKPVLGHLDVFYSAEPRRNAFRRTWASLGEAVRWGYMARLEGIGLWSLEFFPSD